jgi:hypothetical protein
MIDIWGLVLFKSTFEMLIFMNTAFEFKCKSKISSCFNQINTSLYLIDSPRKLEMMMYQKNVLHHVM